MGKMVRQFKRQVRETFKLKMNVVWTPIQFKLWKQRISLNSNLSARLVWRRKSVLFWLVTVPSGLISDKNIPEQFAIALIKSPKSKRNFDPFVLPQDSSFCVEKLGTNLLCLKQKHSDGSLREKPYFPSFGISWKAQKDQVNNFPSNFWLK